MDHCIIVTHHSGFKAMLHKAIADLYLMATLTSGEMPRATGLKGKVSATFKSPKDHNNQVFSLGRGSIYDIK